PGYNTLSLSFDQLLFSAKKNLSIGGIIIYDQSGTIGMTMSKMYISGSYKKKSGKNKYLFGLQAGGVLRQFNDANALYSNQFDHSTGYHNPVLPSGEIAMAENSNYFNMNIGFVWGRNFSRFKTEAGIAVFNINYPKEGFTGSQDRVRPKLLYSVDLTWFVSHRFYVQPQIIFMQLTGANSLIGGSEFQLLTGNHTSGIESIFMGAYVRSGFNRTTDAVIVSAGINFLKFRLGLSYDLNISELQQYTNSVGAFELSLIYTGISTVFDPGALPCARQ
ncbi:MAG: type IX secretion system membrane protein PorP/SprF, partial [Bacteroidota bacterium]|nr:type IX secretion system membrane protein PorP/SprF [Bacteroidota bacterium]